MLTGAGETTVRDCIAAFFAPEAITYTCPAETAAAEEAAAAARDAGPPKLESVGKAASPASGGAASDASAARKARCWNWFPR